MRFLSAAIFICCFFLLFSSCANGSMINHPGYRDVTVFEDSFIAVGTNGRIDLINKQGEITHLESDIQNTLNSILIHNNKLFAAGEKGIILISDDKKVFKPFETGIKENINSIAGFNNMVVAGADNGTILIGNETNKWELVKLQVKGNIVSLSTGNQGCFGVTDKGEIISTTNGKDWIIFDYNREYNGFAKPCIFKKILVTDNWISIAAYHEDNTPVALFSSKGNVWTVRSLNYEDEKGTVQFFTGIPNDIVYNYYEDVFLLVCNNGEISVLPSCTKCNEAYKISDKSLWALTFSDDTMIIVGDDFYTHTSEIHSTR